ncbi:EscU/YscU/HrcU family type III secretion system export apparatus switch protein [Pseudomonas azerbaijanorientalis]|uniref:EscU/YscU/HrcU family type III secretion system export apparatus switch protein n=1 Tax=Pseudomonas azerbaijanorientalis TaxID=2842350 RepID=UPI001CECEAF1|nr:EscU/YscU/HrcU family type III secretion system export apparatus switch protein [Pseudomonas azerbaijanorientalis]
MNRRLLSLFVLPFWLGALLSLVPLAARANADGYVAREQSVRTFFSELSGPLGKPVIVSKTAAAKRISGAFDLRSPQRTFERVSAQMGLIWYSDGQAIYLYDASEVKSSMMSLQTLTVTRLQAFLERSGLHDARYPLRHDGLRTFHVSGPPMYVDLVVQAAGLMDNQRSELLLGKQQIGVIQVRNTFVSDRKYELRDDKVTIPGLATVIEDLLRGEKREVEPSVAQAPAQRPQGLMPAFPLEGLASAPSEQDPTAPRIIAREVAAGNIRVLQSGFALASEALKLNLGALNPINGFKKLFSMRTVKDTVKALLYLGSFALALWIVWITQRQLLFAQLFAQASDLFAIWGHLLLVLVLAFLGCVLLIVALDALSEYWLFMKDQMMDKDSVKREHKEQDGNPEIKGRRRDLHRELLSEQIKSDVRNSRMIIANPTHIAIGVYFRPEITVLPFISLMETNQRALAVRAYAKEVGVPVINDIALARRIFKTHQRYSFLQVQEIEEVLRLSKRPKTICANRLRCISTP